MTIKTSVLRECVTLRLNVNSRQQIYLVMAYQNCQICILLLLLSCTIQSYLIREDEMTQEFASSENEIFEIKRPVLFFEDQKNSNMKRSGSGNIRLLRKKSDQPKVGIRLLQI